MLRSGICLTQRVTTFHINDIPQATSRLTAISTASMMITEDLREDRLLQATVSPRIGGIWAIETLILYTTKNVVGQLSWGSRGFMGKDSITLASSGTTSPSSKLRTWASDPNYCHVVDALYTWCLLHRPKLHDVTIWSHGTCKSLLKNDIFTQAETP